MTSNFSKADEIPFVKMHGIGNDFIVLDALRSPLPDNFDFARVAEVLCARHFGVGGDGLLLLTRGESTTVRMRMWNPDGSEDMCGNGLRCIAWLAFSRGYILSREFQVETLAGVRHCEVLRQNEVRVEMGKPSFEFNAIPFAPDTPMTQATEYSLPLGTLEIPRLVSLSTGSAHTVIFVDELPDDESFFTLSPQIETHSWFPERTSVLWTKVVSENQLQLRIWERGVGETLACGTGACAAAVAAQITRRAGEEIDVQSKGGVLGIAWREGETIRMTGPAQIAFEGTVGIPLEPLR
jgi:diaminopimelate epimerase